MDDEGHLRGLSNVARDQTARMRAERAMSFLADVGRVLAGSLDYHTTFDRVARLATRELAQVCIVEMLVGNAHPTRRGLASRRSLRAARPEGRAAHA